jgi:hypothetical protein
MPGENNGRIGCLGAVVLLLIGIGIEVLAQKSDESSIREWAAGQKLVAEDIERSVVQKGPFTWDWRNDDHDRIYVANVRAANGDPPAKHRVWFRIRSFGMDARNE